jgi:hypothetical protein
MSPAASVKNESLSFFSRKTKCLKESFQNVNEVKTGGRQFQLVSSSKTGLERSSSNYQ